MVGIKVGVNDGWGPVQIGTPESSECGAGKSCVRLEVDEIEDPNGEMCKFNFNYFSNVFTCLE